MILKVIELKGSNIGLSFQLSDVLKKSSLANKTKCKTLVDLAYASYGTDVAFTEKDGEWLACWILAHTPTNGVGMRRILTNIMDRV